MLVFKIWRIAKAETVYVFIQSSRVHFSQAREAAFNLRVIVVIIILSIIYIGQVNDIVIEYYRLRPHQTLI